LIPALPKNIHQQGSICPTESEGLCLLSFLFTDRCPDSTTEGETKPNPPEINHPSHVIFFPFDPIPLNKHLQPSTSPPFHLCLHPDLLFGIQRDDGVGIGSSSFPPSILQDLLLDDVCARMRCLFFGVCLRGKEGDKGKRKDRRRNKWKERVRQKQRRGGGKSAGDETSGIEGEGMIERRGMNDLIVII